MRMNLTNQLTAEDSAGGKHIINEYTEVHENTDRSAVGPKVYWMADGSSAVNKISETIFEIVVSGELVSTITK